MTTFNSTKPTVDPVVLERLIFHHVAEVSSLDCEEIDGWDLTASELAMKTLSAQENIKDAHRTTIFSTGVEIGIDATLSVLSSPLSPDHDGISSALERAKDELQESADNVREENARQHTTETGREDPQTHAFPKVTVARQLMPNVPGRSRRV